MYPAHTLSQGSSSQGRCNRQSSCRLTQVLWGALFVLAVLVRDAETAADAAAIDAIASTGMLYVLQKILTEYQVRSRSSCSDDQVLLHPRTTDPY